MPIELAPRANPCRHEFLHDCYAVINLSVRHAFKATNRVTQRIEAPYPLLGNAGDC